MTSRRDFLASAAVTATGLALGPLAACSRETPAPPSAPATPAAPPPRASPPAPAAESLIARAIPATGEQVPVIGAGTSGSYEVPLGSGEFETLKETIRVFFEGGGAVFDTSPNYSNAEDVLGALLAEGGWRERCFLATKLAATTAPRWRRSGRTRCAGCAPTGSSCCRCTTCARGRCPALCPRT